MQVAGDGTYFVLDHLPQSTDTLLTAYDHVWMRMLRTRTQ